MGVLRILWNHFQATCYAERIKEAETFLPACVARDHNQFYLRSGDWSWGGVGALIRQIVVVIYLAV